MQGVDYIGAHTDVANACKSTTDSTNKMRTCK